MDKKEAIKLAKTYKKLVNNYLPVSSMYLYGSYAKGTQNANSDIDVAIFIEKSSDDYFNEIPLLWKLRRQVSTLIEPVLFDKKDIDSPLYEQVMQSGIII
ncbi:MAG: polymerase beta domain protein region [Bacteroidetes bacterium]|nr:polymerase beta domain protein region [Bacteroidota bacterium]